MPFSLARYMYYIQYYVYLYIFAVLNFLIIYVCGRGTVGRLSSIRRECRYQFAHVITINNRLRLERETINTHYNGNMNLKSLFLSLDIYVLYIDYYIYIYIA